MYMIDTHAHLDFPQYDSDREEVIESGFGKGLEAIVNIGVDIDSSMKSIELAKKYENIFATVGIHPHDSGNAPSDYIDRLREFSVHKKVVAVGEIGLDYYRDHSPRDIQRKVFKQQLDLAYETGLPAVVHIRDAMEDSFKILGGSKVGKGVLHSFPGTIEDAKTAVDMGFYISFAGPITYPRSSRPEVAASIPLSRIVTETDAPYLTPQAFRGKRNRPDYVSYVIEKLSSIFSPYTYADMERITSHNARRLFSLPTAEDPKIVYKIRRSLYINLTNRCSCNCCFCPRSRKSDGYVAGHYLYLKSEPSANQVIEAIEKENDYDEIVFCGLGEPTLRLKEMIKIAEHLKAKDRKLRLNTNGHGSLVNKTDVPARIANLIDKVSVSLNAPDAETYIEICKPDRGAESYSAMLEFIKGCKRAGIETTVTAVDLDEVDIDSCRKTADDLGVEFRVRQYIKNN